MQTDKNKSLLSAKKAAGTLNKVISMIEADDYCPDIIQQLDAVVGLLRSTRTSLLEGHLDHCLVENLKRDKESAIKELMKIYNLNSK